MSYGALLCGTTLATSSGMIPLEYLVQRGIVTLPESTPAYRAAEVMCQRGVGCVLVTGARDELVGIATDRDLSCLALGSARNPDLPLSKAMTPHPVYVEKKADLEQVVRLMEELGVRRIPVVEWTEDRVQKCIGIVTLDDLIVARSIGYDQHARVIQSQIQRRASLRPRTQVAPISSGDPHHARPSMNLFYRRIQEATQLVDANLEQVTKALLEVIVRRLHYTGAARFIALLPEGLHEDLLGLPAGPDEKATFAGILERLQSSFGYSKDDAQTLVRNFFVILKSLITPAEFEALGLASIAELSGAKRQAA